MIESMMNENPSSEEGKYMQILDLSVAYLGRDGSLELVLPRTEEGSSQIEVIHHNAMLDAVPVITR